MRKLAATVLAFPVLALVYLAYLSRAGLARVGAGLAAATIVALVALTAAPPAPSRAVPSPAPAPVDGRVVNALATGHGLREPMRIEFDAPMDASSVAAAMRLSPDTAVRFEWDDATRVLTIEPLATWQPDTLYVLTVAATARAADGAPLAVALRAAMLTARAGSGAIEATRVDGKLARVTTGFRIRLDRPVPLDAVRAALVVEPNLDGELAAGTEPGEFVFTPSGNLAAGGTYRVSLAGLVDADGVPFADTPELTVRVAGAPEVVRFRPVDGATSVDRNAAVSVRFTEPMKREATAGAFTVSVDGKALSGKISWAEGSTVLVFVPEDPLPYGAKVKLTVAAGAVARSGAPIARATTGTFKVQAKPKAPATGSGDTAPIPKSGGGGAAAANWYGVETYYLRLMNCTRTGGWVTSTGKCNSPGGRDVAPLTLNAGISNKVARPYAKLLATRGLCDHFIGGTPGDRLRAQGYTSYRWGENLGCRSGNPYSAVLGSHRYFQSEKPYNGGHYRNLMDARFRQAGIGVWVSSGRVRLVVDFYTP